MACLILIFLGLVDDGMEMWSRDSLGPAGAILPVERRWGAVRDEKDPNSCPPHV